MHILGRMAKRGRKPNPDAHLKEIVFEHVERLVRTLSDVIRKEVASDVLTFFSEGPATHGGPRRRTKREMACIAPGCKNTSKGPRFHYLCDKHRDASKAEYKAWAAARKGKAAAAA